MAFDIDAALRYVVEHDGSDLHVKVPSPPMVRIHGELGPIAGMEPLKPDDTDRALEQILHDPALLAEFGEVGEADFSYEVSGVSRFRVNAFRQRGHVSIVCRAIPFQIRTIEDLGLPPVIRNLAEEKRGIILLTGTTGSGKSTTLAAMIDQINSTKAEHIVTLEDPIEYLHRDKRSIINQREVGQDTESFGRAMKRVLRQDPDVILIGEMRDEETVRTALSAAETGHLVLSTLHTLDATETINRIIDFFPPHLQQQARVMLAATLRGVVGQRLMPRKGVEGRVAVCEVLVVTGRVQDLILNPNETGKLTEVIAEGEYYGMQTFDQALLHHVMAGTVD
jgi:twitching motility protein PilT